MKNKFFNVAPTTLSNTIVYQTRRDCNPPTDKGRLDSLKFYGSKEQVAKTNYTTAKSLQHKDLSLFPCPLDSKKSPLWKGLNTAIASNDFYCRRCGEKAYLFEQHRNHAKVVCLKHGSQLVWTRRVGGGSDA